MQAPRLGSAAARHDHIVVCRWFVPTLRWFGQSSKHMPRAEMKAVRLATRAVREAAQGLHHVFEEGFDPEFQQASCCSVLRTSSIAYIVSNGAKYPLTGCVKHSD